MNLYEHLLRPLLFKLDAEIAHQIGVHGLEAAGRVPSLLRRVFGPVPKAPCTLCGIPFPNPVGLAAGMDKNAVALPAWEALGFGFVEIGTITARAQSGNPKPRVFRYPAQQALINRMGFNNDGADAVALRLAKLKTSGHWPKIPVGINIGKSKVTPLEEAAADYRYSFDRLADFGDYFVINVSSPNTPGLRELQSHTSLAAILETMRVRHATKPIFVKIAPDLSPEQLASILKLTESEHLSGIVLTNTTLDHSAIPAEKDQQGGLSGAPLRVRALDIFQTLRAQTRLPLIASGGIMSGSDACERFDAGADLVQIYTGFVYKGPALIREICHQFQKFC